MNLEGLTERRNRKGTLYYVDASDDIVAKCCSKCKKVKPLDDYPVDKTKLGLRHSTCKICNSKYIESAKDRRAETSRKWYEANKKHCAEKAQKWRESNKERDTENKRKYYEINKMKLNKYSSIWTQNNYFKKMTITHRRIARKNMLPNTLTSKEYDLTLEYFGNACALTGETIDIEIEHALPITCGHGGTTFQNCYPLTKRLNRSKNNSNIFEWFEANRQRFELSQERFDNLIAYLASANAMTVEEYRDYVYWCHANPRNINELEAN